MNGDRLTDAEFHQYQEIVRAKGSRTAALRYLGIDPWVENGAIVWSRPKAVQRFREALQRVEKA